MPGSVGDETTFRHRVTALPYLHLSPASGTVGINVDEEQLQENSYEGRAALNKQCQAAVIPNQFCCPEKKSVKWNRRNSRFHWRYGLAQSGCRCGSSGNQL